MANIRKTINFRNGVQVDEDNFIVDSLGKVGVGTTVPTQMLDVRGNAKVVGIVTSQSIETRNVNVAGVTTFSGTVHVGAAITIYPASGIISATSIRGDGRFLTGVSAGKFITETAGISTNTSVGVNTSTVDDNDLTGIGNSFKGLYVANGMVITDKELTGVHYIGTNFSSVMAGPVTIGGTITVDGNYVVV